jgi:DNA helicase-2/ATP-dependent DNA helicase PcrA
MVAHEEETPRWLDGIEGDALPLLIASDAKLIRVVAGPGSGKTTGLRRRVMRLVEGRGLSAEKIFVGTFTRAIAGELAAALRVSATPNGLDQEGMDPEISTLHALALKLIREHPTARPGRSLRFLLGFEKEAMLYDIGEAIPGFPKQTDRKRELNRVCAAWAEGTNLEMAGFLGEMDRWLRCHGGMLIDEVVQFARIGLESGDIPAGNFDDVIIDEYQDLTAAEQHLVEKIWSGSGSLVVLGDDDQSIYSFRFNHPRGITEFADRWKAELLEDIEIPDNRRCGRVIVNLANAMMAAAGSKKAPMNSTRGEEGEISPIYWQSVGQEIGGLARYMRARKDTRFLVLVPRRFIGYRLKDAIGDDAQTSFHEEVLEVPLVQERFALASLVANQDDRVALRAVLGFHADGTEHGPKRNAKAYRSIKEAPAGGLALLDAIAKGEIEVTGQGSEHLRARARNAVEFLERLDDKMILEEVIGAIFDPALAAVVPAEDTREQARRDLEHIRDSALAACQELDDPELSTILDHLRYRIAMRIPLAETPEARVRIMTLHGAKGLEADVVVVAGVADQIIPGIPPRDPGEAERVREEQRRLLYVSVTRARQELVISWPKSMEYKDATKNNVRVDQVWRRQDKAQVVSLGRTALLPDIPQQPRTGSSWLKEKLGS